ncbi:hypothetical protein TeGR_g6719, partial [Tetraparma gracilis]
PPPPPFSSWTHYLYSYSAETEEFRGYVDGVLMANASHSVTNYNSSANSGLGDLFSGTVPLFHLGALANYDRASLNLTDVNAQKSMIGSVDNLAVWSTVLEPEEVLLALENKDRCVANEAGAKT